MMDTNLLQKLEKRLIRIFLQDTPMKQYSGSTWSFAFYYSIKDLFIVGELNQMMNAALPIRLSKKIAMMAK
jgi:hypothetical protein